jgi:hypothetical protein
MTPTKALRILDALIRGADPATGLDVPSGSVLEQPDVIRALLEAVSAIKYSNERNARRAQLPKNIGRTWSDEEHEQLIAEFKAGVAIPDIASGHGRTVRAIEARLEKAGLLSKEERTTTDRFDANESTGKQ